MDQRTQLDLIDRIQAHRANGRGTDTASGPMELPTSRYPDVDHLERERDLLHRAPTLVGLSGLVPEPGSYATVALGSRSVIITRDQAGVVHAMANVCRHRGAEVTEGCGSAAILRCPYHGWTYHLDGRMAARRRDEYFAGLPEKDLVALPCSEQHGLIWASAEPGATIPTDPLAGAGDELSAFDLASYQRFAVREFTRPLNWKLAVDTFCEAYHLSVLHKDTLAPMIHDDFALFDTFGPHGRMVATRRSIDQLDSTARDQWRLLPHATILWFLVPNAVLIHQQDHVQLYQSRPGQTPDEAHLTVSIYVPPDSPFGDDHWQKNLDLLIGVTDAEDFATAAGIQRGYRSGAQEVVTFGRNEPALQHYHRALLELLDPT